MNKCMKNFFSIMFLLFFACSAHAAVTYTVTSGPYSAGTGTLDGTYSGSMSLTGQFTLDSPFQPNLSNYDFLALVTSYSFHDGVHTYSQGNSMLIPGILVSTAPSGQVTFLEMNVIAAPPPPHSTNPATLMDYVAFEFLNSGGSYVFALDGGPCSALVGNMCSEIDGASALGLVSLDLAINLDWEISSTAIPTLSQYGLLILVLLMLGLGITRFRRV